MKKVGLALFALVLLTTLSAKCDKKDSDCEKILIMHNGLEIEIAPNAWEAHFEHGDQFIECVPKN